MRQFIVPEGMARSVWENKYARKTENGFQTWSERLAEVVNGNFMLDPRAREEYEADLEDTLVLAQAGVMPFAGRHLQHGDLRQPDKIGEVFTNCLGYETPLATLENGIAPIGSLSGMYVTVKSRDGVWRKVQVKSYGQQVLNSYTFATTSSSNRTITVRATPKHRWFVRQGSPNNWEERVTTDLSKGDQLTSICGPIGRSTNGGKTFDSSHQDVEMDREAICHGLVYGDGSGHKSRKNADKIESQGRSYCSIRLCGTSAKYFEHFELMGYKATYPDSCNGDPVVYVGRRNWKALPYTHDPSYIAGFIYGWFLADGAKRTNMVNSFRIYSACEEAIEWLEKNACLGGFVVTGKRTQHRRKNDGSYPNGKPITGISLAKQSGAVFRVQEVQYGTIPEEVFCVEELVTTGFMLGNGLLTGNCSTAMFSFLKFWLLLKGSGVGRCYDSDICRVNWDFMPNTRFVLDEDHPDWETGMESLAEAKHKYDSESEDVRWFEVEDSGEGWVKVVEVLETAAAQVKHGAKLFIFDFSQVREKGKPIRGQQGRPASGPIPFMQSLQKVASIKGAGMKPWKQALFIDHYLSMCVAVGGIRRSARIATKSWRDKDVIEFIDIKRVESELAKLYTANNSIAVDAEFWEQALRPEPSHARRVFEAAVGAAYFDKTGEPGFLNVDRLTNNETGLDRITVDNYLCEEMMEALELHAKTIELIENTLKWAKKKHYKFIVNPCGEICLSIMGGYCVIGDICLANVEDQQEALDAARLMSPFLMRVNRMPSLYKSEVSRTNRIGVGITGIHEFAYRHFGLSFWDLLDEEKSFSFWAFINEMRREVEQSAVNFAEVTEVAIPHTFTTCKPSGTVSKVMNCTEGAHLPAMPYYTRWIQYPLNDPAVQEHKDRGYPVKDISSMYAGHCVIGFPTKMPIADLMGNALTTAADVTPTDQYTWLRLLEKYWLGGEGKNNQVSYTLKYNPETINYSQFTELVLENQPVVRACSVMPQINESAYVYVPEEAISLEQYEELISNIDRFDKEAVDLERLSCESGACPIEQDINRG